MSHDQGSAVIMMVHSIEQYTPFAMFTSWGKIYMQHNEKGGGQSWSEKSGAVSSMSNACIICTAYRLLLALDIP
mgnify:CR=1 FL=1